MQTLRIAAVQLAAHDLHSFHDAFERAIAAAEEAAARHAQLIVLPEGTIPAYVLGSASIDRAGVQHALDALCAISARTGACIVVGAVREDAGRLYNSGIVIDRGAVAGAGDKTFLWHFDRHWFAPASRVHPVVTSVGTLGVLVCADGRIPTIARELVDRGADVLVMPTAWVTSGRNPDALENLQADLLAGLRAYENGVPFVAANKCGSERGYVAYCGKSQILDARGERVAIASERHPEVLIADVPRERRAIERIQTPPQAMRDASTRAYRVAVTPRAANIDSDAQRILEYDVALSFDDAQSIGRLDALVPVAVVDDPRMLDPAGLIPFRRASRQIVVWKSACDDRSLFERLARARAAELRLYVVALDRTERRAIAVDPDGTIVAGTFDHFCVASFVFDGARTTQTLLAPGTDVLTGLALADDAIGG